MKSTFLTIFAAFLTACATQTQVGPAPDTRPVATSNAATRASIKQTRDSIKQARARIKESQEHAAKGATALDKADDLINQMLKQ